MAEVEYGQGREDRKDVLANLDDDIRNAAERKEMEERFVSVFVFASIQKIMTQ